MSPREGRNLAASVKQRLLNLAKDQGEDFNFLLTRFASERLLYRISLSKHARDFVLKGAMLFHLASGQIPYRPTRDVDLLGRGRPDPSHMERVFREILQREAPPDGMVFQAQSVRAEPIREREEYAGVRLRLEAQIGSARIPLQVDVGFGDAPVPKPKKKTLAALLDFPPPRFLVYPWETVIAEKFQVMIDLGIANSRMKDYFDVHYLSQTFHFEGITLAGAIRATFAGRRKALPEAEALGLSHEFSGNPAKQTQWRAFVRRLGIKNANLSLQDVVKALRGFLLPPVKALLRDEKFQKNWPPGGPWG